MLNVWGARQTSLDFYDCIEAKKSHKKLILLYTCRKSNITEIVVLKCFTLKIIKQHPLTL